MPPLRRKRKRKPKPRKRGGWFAILRQFAEDDLERRVNAPDLNEEKILDCANSHRARTGRWPTKRSGEIPESPGETWMALEIT